MNNATIDVIASPVVEPVSLAEMRAHLRIDVPDETQDAVLSGCISAARQHVEQGTGRLLVAQTVLQRLDGFPDHGASIVLLRLPVAGVIAIAYVDESGVERTLDPGVDYVAAASRDYARVGRLGDRSWPLARCQPGAVGVTYIAGYGSPASVPMDLVAAIKLLAAAWYTQRSDLAAGVSVAAIPRGVEAIINLNRASLQW